MTRTIAACCCRTLFIAILCCWGCLSSDDGGGSSGHAHDGSGNSSYAGTYEGTYSVDGVTAGTWQVTVNGSGTVTGTGDDGEFDITGQVGGDGSLDFGATRRGSTVTSRFVGQIDGSGDVSGTWTDDENGVGGTFEGRRTSSAASGGSGGGSGACEFYDLAVEAAGDDCPSELSACEANAECEQYICCIEDCSSNDPGECALDCADDSPTGFQLTNDLLDCAGGDGGSGDGGDGGSGDGGGDGGSGDGGGGDVCQDFLALMLECLDIDTVEEACDDVFANRLCCAELTDCTAFTGCASQTDGSGCP